MDFSNKIKEIMGKKGVTQAELCRQTKISTALMSNYVTGKVSPSLENAIAIADALNVTLDELVGRVIATAETADNLSRLREEYDLENADIALIRAYVEMPLEVRQAVITFSLQVAENMKVKKPRVPDDQLSVDEKRRIVNGELDAEEKGQILFPSTGLNGMSKISKKKPEKNKPNS